MALFMICRNPLKRKMLAWVVPLESNVPNVFTGTVRWTNFHSFVFATLDGLEPIAIGVSILLCIVLNMFCIFNHSITLFNDCCITLSILLIMEMLFFVVDP